MKWIYFLGAGAAKPCGYPTTPELYTSFAKKRSDLAFFREFGDFLDEMAGKQPIDIETLYHLVSHNRGENRNDLTSRFDRGSLGYQLVRGILQRHTRSGKSSSELSRVFQECRDAITEFIRKEFWRVSPDFEPYRCLRIFEVAGALGSDNVAVFTTNYDTSLEGHLLERVEYTRGFVNGFFTPGALVARYPRGIRLIQLHGSIDLYRLRSGKIIQVNAFQQPGAWKGDEIVGPYLVPPEMGEIHYDETQKYLIDYFHDLVRETRALLVIGFSFRDMQIAETLSNAPRDCSILVACGKRSDTYLRRWFSNHKFAEMTPEHFPSAAILEWIERTGRMLVKEMLGY